MSESFLKWLSLLIMFLQNSITPLIFRIATTSEASEDKYSVPVSVVLGEIIKLFLSFFLICVEQGYSLTKGIATFYVKVILKPHDTIKLAVPATLYFIQNMLLQLAVANLPAALFQVTYQGKTLVVAFFSVFLLKKQLSRFKWVAIGLMATGIAVVQLSKTKEKSQASMKNADEQSIPFGLFLVFLGCLCSGFAGVYFEKMLKGAANEVVEEKPSMWVRNVQLALFSVILGGGVVVFEQGKQFIDPEIENNEGILKGFNFMVWVMVVNNAIGGLCVAFVIKYADNILKGFACALATVCAALAAVPLFGFTLSFQFGLGTIIVVLSMLMYGNAISILHFSFLGCDRNIKYWEAEPPLCRRIRGAPKPITGTSQEQTTFLKENRDP